MAGDRSDTPRNASVFDATMTRSDFLKLSAFAGIGWLLTTCAPAPAPDSTSARLPSPAKKPETPKRQDYENFITQDLREIFAHAYATNGKKDSKGNYDWSDNTATQNVHASLNNQFDLSASLNNPVAQEIDRRAKILINPTTAKPIANLGVPGYNGRWVNYLRAIKELFEEKGIAIVEYTILTSPPAIAVYKKEAVKKEDNNTNPFGQTSIHKRYIVDNQPGNVLFDSNTLLGQDYPLGLAHKQDFDEEEVFIHLRQVQKQTDYLMKVSRGENFTSPEDNPPEKHKYAVLLYQTAQRILADIVNRGGNIGEINLQAIREHEDAHLQKPLQGVKASDEKRSYTAQLISKTPEVSRLSIATYLLNITQKLYLDEISNNPSNPTYVMGIPETIADFVEGVYNPEFQQQNQVIIDKLRITITKSDTIVDMLKKGRDKNDIIHNSQYKPEYVYYALSNLDKLSPEDSNKIAQYIVTKHRKWWLPQGPGNTVYMIAPSAEGQSFLSPTEHANYLHIFGDSLREQAVIFYYDAKRRKMFHPAYTLFSIQGLILAGIPKES